VKAIVTVEPDEEITAGQVIQWCKDHLTKFAVPKEVEFGEVPRTATGKIQKNVLKAREIELAKKAKEQ